MNSCPNTWWSQGLEHGVSTLKSVSEQLSTTERIVSSIHTGESTSMAANHCDAGAVLDLFYDTESCACCRTHVCSEACCTSTLQELADHETGRRQSWSSLTVSQRDAATPTIRRSDERDVGEFSGSSSHQRCVESFTASFRSQHAPSISSLRAREWVSC